MIKVLRNPEKDNAEMRQVFCGTMIELAEKNDKIVSISCDLGRSMGMKPFNDRFPDRGLDVGIQEANACSMAGGMSSAGMIPFLSTFSVFASRRIYDQIFMCCAYPKLNVKIIGGDAGISAAGNGGTHMPFEDMGILRIMPGVTVMEPSDSVMLRDIIRQTAEIYGVQYVRFARGSLPKIYGEGSRFEIGRAVTVRDGHDVSIITCGILVAQALEAAEQLARRGISARVVDMFTLKPADRECIIRCAYQTGAIVTAENHQLKGGLATAVSEILAEEGIGIPFGKIGIHDEFGEVGTEKYLMKRFKLGAEFIAAEAEKALSKKQGKK